jgi:hypothetical protein
MPDFTMTAAAKSGPIAFERAGVTPADIESSLSSRVGLAADTNTNSRRTSTAAATPTRSSNDFRAGVTPDLFDEVSWWDTNDLWIWLLYAPVIYLRGGR